MSRKKRGNFLKPLRSNSSTLNFNTSSKSPIYTLTPYDRKCLERLKKKGPLDVIPVFYTVIGKLRNG